MCVRVYVSLRSSGKARVPNARFDRSFSTQEVRVLSQFRAGLTSFLKAVVDEEGKGEKQREKRRRRRRPQGAIGEDKEEGGGGGRAVAGLWRRHRYRSRFRSMTKPEETIVKSARNFTRGPL